MYYAVIHCAAGLALHTLAPKTKRCVPVARLDARLQAVAEDVGGRDQTVECLLRRHLFVEPDKQRMPPDSTPAGL